MVKKWEFLSSHQTKTTYIFMKQRLLIFLWVALASFGARADEGMWLPHMLEGKTYKQMADMGLKLSADQIYNVNKSSLKDAIVRLGRGFCTGEMISKEGLMLTNHHCGYGAIQELSSVEADYLKDGFWAMKREDELKANFGVSFLQRVEDVTDQVMDEVTEKMTLSERITAINKVKKKLVEENENETKFISVDFKSFYEGNKYYIFVYQTFPDVRLVGTPPSSIGKYGGDTDNWMWPRHTGDFSMFRIYANEDNEPAEYSENNVAYQPKWHLPVSMKGVEKDDYAMIFGYPGSTDRYLTSHGVKYATDVDQPARVKIRRAKLDIYEEYMNQDNKVRIMYASKHARVSNYWKYFIGQTKGLKRLRVYDQKKDQEKAFDAWANESDDRKEMYGDVMNLYKSGYNQRNKYEKFRTYLNEAVFGIESVAFAFTVSGVAGLSSIEDETAKEAKLEELRESVRAHFKDYYKPIDQKVAAAMMKKIYNDLDHAQLPASFLKMAKKSKGDFDALAAKMYKKSMLVDEDKTMAFLDKPSMKKLSKDPIFQMFASFLGTYRGAIAGELQKANEDLARAKRLYVKGLLEMNPNKAYASDANSTMRVTYGQVLDYYPADAVHYDYFTTMDGVMEKYQPGDLEFDLPERFVKLAKDRNYGQYADKDGELRICFLSNNDITGGNSGSPVINAEGHLIGTAFDGNWEAMSGDIAFEPNLQRTISVDIRYTLWVIDVFAGAGHLVEEMTLVK
jgi:hypothetical protein